MLQPPGGICLFAAPIRLGRPRRGRHPGRQYQAVGQTAAFLGRTVAGDGQGGIASTTETPIQRWRITLASLLHGNSCGMHGDKTRHGKLFLMASSSARDISEKTPLAPDRDLRNPLL